jgi:hypothetical protein
LYYDDLISLVQGKQASNYLSAPQMSPSYYIFDIIVSHEV